MIKFTRDPKQYDSLTVAVAAKLKTVGLETESFMEPSHTSTDVFSGHPADDSRTKAHAKYNWHNSKHHEANRQSDEYLRLSHDHMAAKEDTEAKCHHDISCSYAAIAHAHKAIVDNLDKKHKFSAPIKAN